MKQKPLRIKHPIEYSEAFKMEVVRTVEQLHLTFGEAGRKFGIKGKMTITNWVRRYGNGTRGKVIRVQTPDEIEQVKELKRRVRQLESALADLQVTAALEKQFAKIACSRAGITDVAEFKKKVAGQLDVAQ